MNIWAIILGLFVLFAVSFNGGLGNIFVTLPVTISGISLICIGIASINKKAKIPFYFAVVSFAAYLPMIIYIFTLSNSIDWIAFTFNIFILFHIGLLVNYHKPNKAIKKDV